jgi:hypothetical protein
MQLYKEGDKLKDNEYLLKIREDDSEVNTGFMTKFTQKGLIPKSFEDWGVNRWTTIKEEPLPIYVFEEKFREGWKILDWRFGKSQNWATMLHPEGFTVEIYLSQLLELIKEIDVKKGELIGEFKWSNKKLIHRA